MRRRRTVTIMVQWHEVASGLWCTTCMVPSRIRWALLNVDTLNVIARCEQCTDCGQVVQLR